MLYDEQSTPCSIKLRSTSIIGSFQKEFEDTISCTRGAANNCIRQKRLQAYQQLMGQLLENENVEKDMEELTEDNKVFKLIGPVLVEQSLEEARDTVKRRLEFIRDEM